MKRIAAHAAETRLLGEQLRKAHGRLEQGAALSRRLHRAMLPAVLPKIDGVRFGAHVRPGLHAPGELYDVRWLDEDYVGFWLTSVSGSTSSDRSLLAACVRQWTVMTDGVGTSDRIVPPGEVLARVNRELLSLPAEDRSHVAMLAGTINARTGAVMLARGGLPAPLYVPAIGAPTPWNVPGTFLGTAETTYLPLNGTLASGDRLLIGSTDTQPTLAAITRNRGEHGEVFDAAVARDLLDAMDEERDFTLMILEMTPLGLVT